MKIKKGERKRILKALNTIINQPKAFMNGQAKTIKWNTFQKELMEKIKGRDALTKFIWLYGALGSGKTFFGAYLTTILSFMVEQTNILIVREFKKDAIDTNLKKVAEFFIANGFKEGVDFKYSTKEGKITNLITNVVIQAEGGKYSLDSKIRSKEYYFAWLEEATFLSLDNLKVITERTRGSKSAVFGNPFIFITNNPDNVSDIKDFLDKQVKEGRAIEITTTMEDNENNLGNYYETLSAVMDDKTKDKMLKGLYNKNEAYFFSDIEDVFDGQLFYYDIKKKKAELEMSENNISYIIGFDEGMTQAPNAMVLLISDGENFLVEDVEEFGGLLGYSDLVIKIKEFAKRNGLNIDQVQVYLDPAMKRKSRNETGMKSALETFEEYGLNVEVGNNDNKHFVRTFKDLVLERKVWFNFYKAETLIKELKKWKKKYDKEKREYADVPDSRAKNDDALTAFKYGLSALIINTPETKNKMKKQTKNYFDLREHTTYYFNM